MSPYETFCLVFYFVFASFGATLIGVGLYFVYESMKKRSQTWLLSGILTISVGLSIWYVYAWETAAEVEMRLRVANGTWHGQTFFSGEIVQARSGDP